MNISRGIRRLWYVSLVVVMTLFGFQRPALAQMTSAGVDCLQIPTLDLMEQENLRAGLILIECGVVQGGKPSAAHEGNDNDAPQPPNVLVSNRSCSGPATCTKSTSMVSHSARVGDDTVVVTYNDGNGTSFSGVSFSTDGGTTFTEIQPAPFTSGHGANYGDPLLVYNQRLGEWFAGDLASGCGGLGIAMWSSPDGQNWSAAACAHNGSDDDRPSIWVDNNPFSLKYGRMYVSFNDFAVDSGAIFVTYSDDGVDWSTPVQLTTIFIRDVQLTGTLQGPPPPNARYTSTVFLQQWTRAAAVSTSGRTSCSVPPTAV